ncbi:hypothetical protein LguiB_023644 [Lonicera macranthoides]
MLDNKSQGYKEDSDCKEAHIMSCNIALRVKPQRQREKVYVGCGAGFGGDRPMAALKLLQRVEELNYLVLECLAERTLLDRFQARESGGVGYDPRISEWMNLLLPLAVERGVCIITNMGAQDPHGAREKVLEIASSLGVSITVGLAYQFALTKAGMDPHLREIDCTTYLGAKPIVECLEKYRPNVIITSRVADASLFLAPMIYELGWNWNQLYLIAMGSLAGHLLECGCQLTGGYFMHPGDKYRDMPFQELLDISLPYAEVSFDGEVCVAKADGSGGVLNVSTCSEQLLYEIGDPSAYITPDVIMDVRDVSFRSLSKDKVLCAGTKPSAALVPNKFLMLAPKDKGWKGWGEISYGGYECVERAKAAEFLVRSWMEEVYPGVKNCIISYIIGLDSLKATNIDSDISLPSAIGDIRLRMDGVFEQEEQAIQFTKEFIALYTNGPAGGGGISTGHKKEMTLEKALIRREHVHYHIVAKQNKIMHTDAKSTNLKGVTQTHARHIRLSTSIPIETISNSSRKPLSPEIQPGPAPSGQKILLYNVAHSRTGDKGNDLNFSIIPHFLPDISRLKKVLTPQWVKKVVSVLMNSTSFPDKDETERREKWVEENVKVEIYEVTGVSSLNVVVREILDGGVNCSRRIDRHGKCVSDLVLCQQVVLPP